MANPNAFAHMESSFQPRRILNLIRSIQHCRRILMAEKDIGRLPSDVSGMVSVEKAFLSVLTSLISEEVSERRGSLEVEVNGDITSEECLEILTAIISALEPSEEQQQGSPSSAVAAFAAAAAASAPASVVNWISEKGTVILNKGTRILERLLEDLVFKALSWLSYSEDRSQIGDD
ncbi:hypothetical protein ACFX2J_005234 [Malus domestica]